MGLWTEGACEMGSRWTEPTAFTQGGTDSALMWRRRVQMTGSTTDVARWDWATLAGELTGLLGLRGANAADTQVRRGAGC